MSKRIFNPAQIEDLLRNQNVVKCSNKAISYSKDFKIRAVKQYFEDGLPVRQIFVRDGFDLNVIGDDIPAKCLTRWKKTIKSRGVDGLLNDRRGKTPGGGRPRVKNLTDAEKITRLEATVAYLRAENDFLMKLRAQRKS